MLPFHWRLGPFALTPNELFALLGTVLGGLIMRRRLIGLGATKAAYIDFILAALAGGAVGARLYYFLPLWFRGKLAFSALFSSWSDGSGFYGAFLGGAIGIAVTARLKKLPVLSVVDLVSSTVPLGFAVGKIGCFLAGCCYGLPTPFGLRFAKDSLCYNTQRSAGLIPGSAQSSLPVHPIQLYDMIFGFSLFGAVSLLQRRSKRPGEVFAASLVGYSVYRFVIEFFRDDPDCHTFGGAALRDSQYTAIVIFVVASAAWAWLRLRKPPAEIGPATPK
jgi:phosphatidylglycerol:prolipoprotein diacylglycerol transferase